MVIAFKDIKRVSEVNQLDLYTILEYENIQFSMFLMSN